MLKDKINENFKDQKGSMNIKDELWVPIRGSLKVTSKNVRTGEIEHVDEDHNTVTIWARHAMMHMITGSSFSSYGARRLFNTDNGAFGTGSDFPYYGSTENHSSTENPDGTLLSGEQFFTSNGEDYTLEKLWSKSTAEIDSTDDSTAQAGKLEQLTMPFFPTKMLFGTGIEFQDWNEIPVGYKSIYSSEGWGETSSPSTVSFNDKIENETQNRFYSNRFDSSIVKTRTMNDIFSKKIDGDPSNTDFGIEGAIKNGGYISSSQTSTKTAIVSGKRFLKQENQGIGLPCFVYAKRTVRPFVGSSEILLSHDDIGSYENKITYTVKLPAQEDSDFYPYNGYLLKQVGLFCDATLVFDNGVTSSSQSDKMPAGMLIAKRNISPITKSHENEIVAQWTLYF